MAGSDLAVVLPGASYGALGPALLVPILALRQRGAEVHVVRYPPEGPAPFAAERAGDPERPEPTERFNALVTDEIAALLTPSVRRVTFVAKSRGSMVLADMLPERLAGRDVAAIWITPILELSAVRAGIVAKRWRSLLVAGDADSSHRPEAHLAVQAAIGAHSIVLPGADHALHVAGDTLATVDGWRRLAEAVLEFTTTG